MVVARVGDLREIVVRASNSDIQDEIKVFVKWSVLSAGVAPRIAGYSSVYRNTSKITIGPHVLVFGEVKVNNLLQS